MLEHEEVLISRTACDYASDFEKIEIDNGILVHPVKIFRHVKTLDQARSPANDPRRLLHFKMRLTIPSLENFSIPLQYFVRIICNDLGIKCLDNRDAGL